MNSILSALSPSAAVFKHSNSNYPLSFPSTSRKPYSPIRISSSSDNPVITSQSASDIVRKFYDGINRHDLTSVENLIAENCVYEDLIFARPFVGRKEILLFFKKFNDSISTDLQFVIDGLSTEDSSAVGVLWHLEWKGKEFPFSKGCSFYRLDMVNGNREIMYARDSVEPAIKPGEMALNGVQLPRLGYTTHTTIPNKHSSLSIHAALLDEAVSHHNLATKSPEILAFDLVQGSLVKWSNLMDKSSPDPPTAVFLHGILGSRKNWGTFARRMAKEFPAWQFLLVDLRCHGDSTLTRKTSPHTVSATARDVLKLVQRLKITPRVLVGHSFGGKVVLSMVDQAAKPLARPVRVWALDATPGIVRPGGDGEDHPKELISFLSTLPNEVPSKKNVVNTLVQHGFSEDVAQWVVTNLRPTESRGSSTSGFSWVFDLKGIAEMYQSYEDTNLWKIVEDVPRGVHINFLKAERSLHRWALEDIQRIHAAEELAVEEGGGVEMHVLEDAGHWVHADNPDGLFRILSSSFKGFKT